MPLHLGCSEIEGIFAPGGKLSREIAEYESRPQQADFACRLLGMLEEGGCLVIEAATGVGKSLGYLVPSLSISLSRESPVIISTNTKNLQEQLIQKDVPVLRGMFGGGFSAASLKGRGNYLCLRKWKFLLEAEKDEKTERFTNCVSSCLAARPSGDVGEAAASVSGNLWEQVSSDLSTCTGTACAHHGSCYWRKARRKASQANLVVVNHSLLFSDVGCQRTILPEHDTIIMDEAHNIERVATDHFGVEVTGSRLRREIERILSGRGLLSSVRKRVTRKLPKLRRLSVSAKLDELERVLNRLGGASESAFGGISHLVEAGGRRGTVRFGPTVSGEENLSLPQKFEELSYACSSVADLLQSLVEIVKENSELIKDVEDLLAEAGGAMERWKALASDLMFLWEAGDPGFVYWIEGRQNDDMAARACPVWVREELREHVFSHLRALVMTSATMAVAGTLEHFVFRMGLDGKYEPRCAVIDSPFDYSKQVTVRVPLDFVDPRHSDFARDTAALLTKLLEASPRKTLVLFTAYDMLREVHGLIARPFKGMGFGVFGQGIDGARSELIEGFQLSRKAVLLGTASFWEGIDLPGEALEQLVLVRLPFPVPDDPIVQARSEALLAEGKEPFMEYLLPEAVIKLRQGFGRLIRRRTDRGAVVIVDPRIMRASYGGTFVRSLPAPIEPCRAFELPARISEWFGAGETGRVRRTRMSRMV
ncbi:MAG: helicase C-terminal domain-containing protein [Candidatus Eisenbacteria bacterium]